MPESSEKKFVNSIENASIMNKFAALFIVMSVLPFLTLYYFYYEFVQKGTITVSKDSFNIALIFITFGVMVGFGTMRALLKKIVDLNEMNRRTLQKILDPQTVKKINVEQNEITALTRTFSEITNRLEENVRSLELAKKTLHTVMGKVGQGISNMQNIDTFLELILETVTDALNGRVGVLLLVDETNSELWVKTTYGIKYEGQDAIRIKVEPGTTMHTLIRSRKPIVLPRLTSEFSGSKSPSLFEPPLICSPMVIKDHVRGIITISGAKSQNSFAEEDINLLFNIASQTAVAIENSRLSENIEKTYFETISALALAVDARDKYSRGHLDRVADYCMRIAKKLGLENEDMKTLRDAARLHDLGKIGIPDEVLNKGGPLNEQEWALMRRHPEIGESIIKPIRSLNHVCDIIRHHHEKLDGSGYPDGLKGSQITPLVRITTVADIYDALTTDRPYRKKMPREIAYQELRKMKSLIDQDIVEAFIEALESDS